MNYPFTSKSSVVSDGNLFDLFSVNSLSLGAYKRINKDTVPSLCLKQSFQSASKAFKVIDSPTRGVIVPFGKEGKQIINDLCAAFELEKQYKLLKKAQRYSVNVYENVFNDLSKKGIIKEVQSEDGTGIYYLDAQHYSEEFGISKKIVNEMETYIA
jgi:CRISPR-associated endonuclease/helicase Cas3